MSDYRSLVALKGRSGRWGGGGGKRDGGGDGGGGVVGDGGGGQGSRKSKIGWELTKNGCHVRSPGL